MIAEYGHFKVDIDVEKTRRFYLIADGINCACDRCINFIEAINILPQKVRSFFDNLGIDMKKPCESYVDDMNTDGTLNYSGFYHVCGNILEGESAWVKEGRAYRWNCFIITPDFRVSFQKKKWGCWKKTSRALRYNLILMRIFRAY